MCRSTNANMASLIEPPSNCKVLLGKTLAKPILEEVKEGLKKINRSPLLVSFLASSDPPAREYAESTGKTCREKYDGQNHVYVDSGG
jgi:methylenetetrahydrofolate dehydrogenase (NAD+)